MSKGDAANVHLESEPAAIWPGYLSASVLPFVLHLGFMACTAFFIMHVQVVSTVLFSSASIYHVKKTSQCDLELL